MKSISTLKNTNEKFIASSPFIKEFNLSPNSTGELNGLTFAVKDVIDIKGEKTSCGNPTWLEQQIICKDNAICIELLLAKGATCLGKTVLGEFSSGSTGVNHFFGMPLNPNAITRVPGGSSSGSASAVAANIIDFSLGTDAAGSVRVPASFCGIIGMRPSHGNIPMNGVKSFSPTFDTIGIFSKSIEILEKVYNVMTKINAERNSNSINYFYVIEDYLKLLSSEHRTIYHKFIENYCNILQLKPTFIQLTDIHTNVKNPETGISIIFKNILCSEIWKNIGIWAKNNLEFSKTTFVDFSVMSNIDNNTLLTAYKWKEIYSEKLNSLLSTNNVLCIPTTPEIAPLRNHEFKKVNEFNYEKLRPLIALSGIGRLPQITIPINAKNSTPMGVSLLSGHQQDQFLIENIKKIIGFKKVLNK